MDEALEHILEEAKRIRRKCGPNAFQPVAIMEFGPEQRGLVNLDMETEEERKAAMVTVGIVARNKRASVAYVVHEVMMMGRDSGHVASIEKGKEFSLEDWPLEDRRFGLFIMAINFADPTLSTSIIQEYRFLGRREPEYLPPLIAYPFTPNGLYSPIIKAYGGDLCGVEGLRIEEEHFFNGEISPNGPDSPL